MEMEPVSEDESPSDRSAVLGFTPQKENKYNNLLPYAEQLDAESNLLLADIKGNLGRTLMLREISPGARVWTARLIKYIRLYGMKFSKADHILFIKTLYELTTIPKLEPYLVNKFGSVLIELLGKKDLLSPEELELPWRPLYKLRKRIIEESHAELGMYRYFSNLDSGLTGLMLEARHYFPASATQEILDVFRPNLCPFDAQFQRCMEAMCLLLPVMRKKGVKKQGYELWLTEFMQMWETYGNGSSFESDLMWLIARLAHLNIGHVDWEPYMAIMFSRFQRSLHLPVLYKKTHSSKVLKLDMSAVALWIVSTMGGGGSTQKYFVKFMKSIESYIQPANFGRWVIKLRELIKRLIYAFTSRVHRERVKKTPWEPPVPESHRLTDADIDWFVEAMQPIALQAMYSKSNALDMVQVLQNLATLRPNIVIPPIIEKMYLNLDTITEPHKLTVSMMCVVAVARPMLESRGCLAGAYLDGPTHVLPLLTAVLPGIDPNDSLKCFVTFQFISTFASLVPLMDCSRASEYWKDLTEVEEVVCAATAGFEDFVLQLLDRCFVLIESSSIDQARQEQEAEKWEGETLTEGALLSTLVSMLSQTSPDIFQNALHKLHQFVMSRILETSVAGMLLAVVCQAFAMVNAEVTLHVLLPPLCATVMSLTEAEEIVNEPHLDNELLYNLLLLAEMVSCDGSALVAHVPLLVGVLERTLPLVSREGQQCAGRLLCHLLDSLVHIRPTEYRSTPYPLDQATLANHLPVRDWAEPVVTSRVRMEWHVPSAEELRCVQQLVTRFLPPELDKLEAFIAGERTLTREQLQGSLNLVMSILAGRPLLPLWDEPCIRLIDSYVNMAPFHLITGCGKAKITLPDGGNVRQRVARVMVALQQKLLDKHEDDTKSFFLLVSIYELLLCNQGYSRTEFDSHWKNFSFLKQLLVNKLSGRRRQLRRMVLDRAVLQHKRRLAETSSSIVSATHRDILLALFALSTSQYSEVRSKAQGSLNMALSTFAFSYRLILPGLLEVLALDSNEHHERFKGALYVMLGPKQTPIIAKHNWEVVSQLWLALVRSKPSEKLSVVRLIESLVDSVHKHFPTITLKIQIPNGVVRCGEALWKTAPHPFIKAPSDHDVKMGVAANDVNSDNRVRQYMKLVDSLVNAVCKESLHWRYNSMAISFLRDLVHPDVIFSAEAVRVFLTTLVNDSINLRKVAICSVVFALQQYKRPHVKVLVDPRTYEEGSGLRLLPSDAPDAPVSSEGPGDHRPDTAWLQYCHATRPLSAEQWDQPRYMHRTYAGYHAWPSRMEVYAPASAQPTLMRTRKEVSLEEIMVIEFFTKQANVDRFIEFLSLEERKGKDKFNSKRFILFKLLFRNHGPEVLEPLIHHLQRLVADKNESSQRCAAEIIAGAIKGSKHWSFEQVEAMWSKLDPIIRTALANMTEETVGDWGVCFATASESRDPNRQHWLLELLMEDPLREEASFKDCGRLYALQGALNQHEWRVAELLHRLLDYLKPFLTHPFQNVRERLGSVLTNVFNLDVELPDGQRTRSPHVDQFMEEMMQRLEILYQDGPKMLDQGAAKNGNGSSAQPTQTVPAEAGDTSEGKAEVTAARDVALCLLKTVCRWASGNILRSCYGAKVEFYQLFPLACLLESYEGDDEISKSCNMFLSHLAFSHVLPARVPAIFTAVHKVLGLGSWRARSTCLDFLQVLVFHNMPTFLSQEDWVQEVTGVVLRLLRDERLEVREKAAQVLGGLLHCDFVSAQQTLLSKFTKQSRTRLRRNETVDTYTAESMVARHSGVLGLCAFIDAYPYDVPDFVPDVFSVLGDHLNDPPPISATIRKTLGNFKRTHHDNWQNHKLKFSEDQLGVLSDLLVPPTYYA